MTADRREARLARGEKKDEVPVVGTPVEPSKETWGKQYGEIDTRKYRSVPVTGKPIKVASIPYAFSKTLENGKKEIERGNITNAVVENYTYGKNGKMIADVSYDIPKTSTKVGGSDASETTTTTGKRKQQVQLSPETEAQIAKKLGLTVKELRESATNPDAGKETAAERALRIANGG